MMPARISDAQLGITVYPYEVPDGDPCERCPRTLGRGGRYVIHDGIRERLCRDCTADLRKKKRNARIAADPSLCTLTLGHGGLHDHNPNQQRGFLHGQDCGEKVHRPAKAYRNA